MKYIRFKDADFRFHTVAIDDGELHGDARVLCNRLASEGLFIATGEKFALLSYLNNAETKSRIVTVERTGWHKINGKDCFILPSFAFGQPENESVYFTGKSVAYASHGSLEAWVNSIAKPCEGQVLPLIALSSAFAGVLLGLLGIEGGGVHFYGQSSKGKTTLLNIAASVWGKGDKTFINNWRSTANGLEGKAALHSDTLFFA